MDLEDNWVNGTCMKSDAWGNGGQTMCLHENRLRQTRFCVYMKGEFDILSASGSTQENNILGKVKTQHKI